MARTQPAPSWQAAASGGLPVAGAGHLGDKRPTTTWAVSLRRGRREPRSTTWADLLMLAIGRVSAPVTVMRARGLSHHLPPWGNSAGRRRGVSTPRGPRGRPSTECRTRMRQVLSSAAARAETTSKTDRLRDYITPQDRHGVPDRAPALRAGHQCHVAAGAWRSLKAPRAHHSAAAAA